MKKKIAILGFLTCSIFQFAQCTINGKSSISVLEEETYTVANESAQCKDCHLWVGIGGNTSIVGDNRQNQVKIKATSGGRAVLSASILTSGGLMQCSKNIDIIDASSAASSSNTAVVEVSKTNPDCTIEFTNYKEVKTAEQIVSFFPNATKEIEKYNWTVTYFDGSSMSSQEKTPQFPFTKENGIQKVALKIVSTKCLRDFTKTYESNYWKFFK